MAHQILKDCRFWVDQYDLSGDANSHRATFTQEAVNATTFGNAGAHTYLPGLKGASHQHSMFFDADGVDAPFDALSANSEMIVSLTPATDVEGGASLLYQSINSQFTPLEGTVGDMANFQLTGTVTGPVVGGVILAPKAARTTSTNTTGFEVGAVAAGRSVYAALHVFSGTASTLAVKVQSDTVGFASPTDRITFATATPSTNLAQFSSAAGAITDTYWRAIWTIAGGTWTFAVTLGIT